MHRVLKTALSVLVFASTIPFYAGFFDDFDTNKFVNNVADSVLNQKPKVKDLLFAKSMSAEGMPQEITKDFSVNDSRVYVFLKIEDFDEYDSISAEWSYGSNNSWQKIGNFEMKPPKGAVDAYFFISKQEGYSWPVGEYKVDISVNNESALTRYFNITGESSSSAAQTSKTAKSPSKGKSEILNLIMAKGMDSNSDPVDVAESFAPTDMSIYLFFNTKNVNAADTLSSKWYVMNGSDWEEIANVSIQPPDDSTNAHFALRKTDGKPWYEGEYKVDVFVKGVPKATKYFTIASSEQQEREIVSSVLSSSKGSQPSEMKVSAPQETSSTPSETPSSSPVSKQSAEDDFSL
jgi:hypothetical protein